MNSLDKWYFFDQSVQVDTPALIFYPERVKRNIEILIGMVDDPSRLRPHIKTAKSKEPVMLMMEAGISKFKCATIAEAEMLSRCEAPDVLLAYQPGFVKLQRLLKLIKRYPHTRFSCLVDNQESAGMFSEAAVQHQVNLSVYIDLNVGMNRTGIAPCQEAIDLFEKINGMSNLKLEGFHAYDGHIREKDFSKRKQLCDDCFIGVEKIRKDLKDKGYSFPLLIAGGSPTFKIHFERKNTEVSPGTFIFWDRGYQENIPEQNFLPAALVLSRVISLPTKNKICIDLGYKSIASENDLSHRVYFLNAPSLKPFSHSEEHMVIEVDNNHKYRIGDIFYALPIHICPTVALYDAGCCIENGKIENSWKIIARDRKIVY
jgi:D-serine deaminase-like pyridoxal phosphate-dependent protein